MPSEVALTLYEHNDETVDLVFYEDEARTIPLILDGRDVEMLVKTGKRQDDAEAETVGTQDGSVIITDSIEGKAAALVPGSVVTTDKAFYRADAIEVANGHRKTGVYGDLTVTDL